MPQRWHWLRLRTTCHPTEDEERVRQALAICSGIADDDALDELLERTVVESHHGGEVVVLEATLSRAKDVRTALAGLSRDDVARLLSESDARMDDRGILHFRTGKQVALKGTVALTTGDDAVQWRLKPEVHPASREAAMDAITAWAEGG